ncbi:hypothetical protein GC105_11565 [Alkalibaculum sp. M08DMB]|uniref:Uncharacterized protein n=1 Tax=Alkalibaculum sporogenes TaxID=2655001 RepID=A0A6A7KB65_9FIRM|nr:hypothetical protein [Alkalibaculum sporogenes]MPW26427.1 hypothetical protein [Alkalibaculum sporogenes]
MIYENTRENQSQFDKFWNSLAEVNKNLPKTCDQMAKQTLKELDLIKGDKVFSVQEVKDMIIKCLQGY